MPYARRRAGDDFRAGGGTKGSRRQVDGRMFLELFERVLDQFEPDILLTYGGMGCRASWTGQAARHPRGICLHNFAYEKSWRFVSAVDAVLVPSRLPRYTTAGMAEQTHLWKWERVRCASIDRRYLTFRQSPATQGCFLFVRIAD